MKFNLLLIAICTLCLNCDLFSGRSNYDSPDGYGNGMPDQKVRDLFKAVEAGDYDKIVSGIEGGISANVVDSIGEPLLLVAVKHNQAKIVKYLIEKGADVNKKGFFTFPITEAIIQNNVGIIRLLAKSKANLEVTDVIGFTTLQSIMLSGSVARYQGSETSKFIEIAKILVSNGASLTMPKNSINQPTLWALEMGDRDLALDMINRNADPNVQDFLGYTLLHRAAEEGDIALGRLLLTKHAKPNLQTKYSDETPLHLAIKNIHPEMIFLLLSDFGADLYIKDFLGRTAVSEFVQRYFFFSDAAFRTKFDKYFSAKFGQTYEDFVNGSKSTKPITAPSLPNMPTECNDKFASGYTAGGGDLDADWKSMDTKKDATDDFRNYLASFRQRITKTYHKLALKWHSDRCKTADCDPIFKDINNCRETLLKAIDGYIEFYGSK